MERTSIELIPERRRLQNHSVRLYHSQHSSKENVGERLKRVQVGEAIEFSQESFEHNIIALRAPKVGMTEFEVRLQPARLQRRVARPLPAAEAWRWAGEAARALCP